MRTVTTETGRQRAGGEADELPEGVVAPLGESAGAAREGLLEANPDRA